MNFQVAKYLIKQARALKVVIELGVKLSLGVVITKNSNLEKDYSMELE